MDTHINPSPELTFDQSAPIARLPGEPDLDAAAAGPAPLPTEAVAEPAVPPTSVRRGRRRSSLLGGIAVAVLFVAGTGAFILSPYNHIAPLSPGVRSHVRQLAGRAGIKWDEPVLAPSAQLATVNLTPRPAQAVLPAYRPASRDEAVREVVAMRPGASLPSVAPNPLPPTSPQPQIVHPAEPGAVLEPGGVSQPQAAASPDAPPPVPAPAAPRNDITADVTRAALGQAAVADRAASTQSAPVPAPVTARAAPAPATALAAEQALDQAARLQPAPMSGREQVQVLQAVTEIATLVKDLRTQNAALRADIVRRSEQNRTRLADFERRLNLAEAQAAIRAASVDPEAPAPPVAPVVPAVAAAPISAAPADTSQRRYRVRAASPGMAMLAEQGRGGGDGAQIQVLVGDIVPGWVLGDHDPVHPALRHRRHLAGDIQ
jgi:hypothetical protein